MFRHGPSCLEGPLSRTLAQWAAQKPPSAETEASYEASSNPSPPDPEIRTELVERIRRAIAEGHYLTAEKWAAALELLFKRLQDS